jgi:hypothetical protein
MLRDRQSGALIFCMRCCACKKYKLNAKGPLIGSPLLLINQKTIWQARRHMPKILDSIYSNAYLTHNIYVADRHSMYWVA